MKKSIFFLGALACALAVSCSDSGDDNQTPDPTPTPTADLYNVIWCSSDEDNTPSFAQAVSDLDSGEIEGRNGFETPSVRSAYTFTSSDGKYLYNYSYGGGTFDKYEVKGGANYVSVGVQLNLTDAIGSTHGRCSKLTDELASAHNIVIEPQFAEDGTTYSYTKAFLNLAIVDLENVLIDDQRKIEIPRTQYDIDNNMYIWRVHMPYIQDGKIYYGIARSKANASDPTSTDSKNVKGLSGVLVMDYPSFENVQVIDSPQTADFDGGIMGDTYGFRSRPIYSYGGDGANKDDLYQLAMTNSYILKITNGAYDESYVFKLEDALGAGEALKTAGWHYVGNGIGYVPYGTASGSDDWAIARVDLNTKTAIKMNIPGSYDFWEYQSSRLIGDKLYMAVCPVDGSGNIYAFDINSTSPEGFEKGAVLKGAAAAYYAGIF